MKTLNYLVIDIRNTLEKYLIEITYSHNIMKSVFIFSEILQIHA